MNRRIVALCVLLSLLLAAFGTAYAQDPNSFPDRDGDGVMDDYDACPDLPGNYYGCPDGVAPPDRDDDGTPDVADNCPDIFGDPFFNGCLDSDGDGIDDFFDSCPNLFGLSQNFGCPLDVPPDWDNDGILNNDDYCPYEAGPEVFGGCPEVYADDNDGDGVLNYMDTCPDDFGLASNFGCPEGVIPDWDYDGVPDGEDFCPRQYGSPLNNGCILDRDGDLIEDDYDACPDHPGDGRNFGCPPEMAPPDSDGDGVVDIYDRCPAEAGTNGLDCPDRDNDFVADIDDQCPDEPGEPFLAGCSRVGETTLPANRAVISAANVSTLAEVGALRLPVRMIQIAHTGRMAVQSYGVDPMTIYDLNAPTISMASVLESQGGLMAMSANGLVIVDTLYDYMTNAPALTIWDVNTSNGLYLPFEGDDANYVSDIAVSPDGSRFATSNGVLYFGPPLETYSVRVYDSASASLLYAINDSAILIQLAFSPDGSRLAIGTPDDVRIVDVTTGSTLLTLASGGNAYGDSNTLVFSPDGSRIATTQGNELTVFDANSGAEVFRTVVLNATPWDAVNGVAFSPDGSLIAASGGPYVDGARPANMNLQVVVMDANTGTHLRVLANLAGFPQSIAFSPDGTLLIFSDYSGVHFYAAR